MATNPQTCMCSVIELNAIPRMPTSNTARPQIPIASGDPKTLAAVEIATLLVTSTPPACSVLAVAMTMRLVANA